MDIISTPGFSIYSAFKFLLNLEHRYAGALLCRQLWTFDTICISLLSCKVIQESSDRSCALNKQTQDMLGKMAQDGVKYCGMSFPSF